MESGDGLLVRVRPGRGARGMNAAQLRELVRLASAHGNGLIEVTRRARLQLRGVRQGALLDLQNTLVALGLAESSPERERSAALIVNPYAGLSRHAAELNEIAQTLEQALATSRQCASLSDKFGVLLDSGYALSTIPGDIHLELVAAAPARAIVHVANGNGSWRLLGECDARRATTLAIELCRAVSELGPKRRMRDLVATNGIEAVRARAAPMLLNAEALAAGGAARTISFMAPENDSDRRRALEAEPSPHHNSTATLATHRMTGSDTPASSTAATSIDRGTQSPLTTAAVRPRSRAIGFHQGHCAWLELGIAFGSGGHELWSTTAEIASRFGNGEVRFTPWRTVILPEVSAGEAAQIAREAGLIVDPDDALLRAVACPGSPACSSAHGPTRSLARELALLLAADASLHVSGCSKGCARSDAADVTVVLSPNGCAVGFEQSVAQAAAANPVDIASARAEIRGRYTHRAVRETTSRPDDAATPQRDAAGLSPSRPEKRISSKRALAQAAAPVQARGPATRD
jgi:precorrin-3B synthase